MKSREEDHDLTQGVIWRELLVFFLPIAAGMLFQQLYNTVDAVVVGKYVGTGALAAVGGSTSQVINLCIGFFVALSGGASVVIAQLFGAADREAVSRATHTAVLFSILMGAVLSIAGYYAAPPVLRLMGTPSETLAAAASYLRIYFSGTLFVLLFNMGSGILRAVGDSRRPFLYLGACCACNTALDLIFVLVLHWGVAGAALATVFSQALSTFLVLLQLLRSRQPYRVIPRRLRIDGLLLRRMLRIGVPAGLQASMYNLSNLIVQVGVNTLGTAVVASWTMTGKIDGIYWAVSNALGTAVMSFVGQNYGAGKYDRIRKTVRVSLSLFMGVTLALIGLLLTIGRFGLQLFSNDPAVIACTWEMMHWLVPFYVAWTLIEVLSGTLRGVGDAIVPVVITAAGICGLRVVWIGTVFVRFHTVVGFTLCYPVSWTITALALVLYYRRGRWLHGKAAAEPENPPAQRESP